MTAISEPGGEEVHERRIHGGSGAVSKHDRHRSLSRAVKEKVGIGSH